MNARLRFTLTMLLLAVIASLIASNYKTTARVKDHSSAQRQRRMEDHSHSDTPVRIVDIRIGQRKVTFKESFDGGDDWLRGLVITLKNRSTQDVSHVGIDLMIERPAEETGQIPAFWTIAYGSNPFWLKPEEAKLALTVQPLHPGETHELVLTEEAYKDMIGFLKKAGYSSTGGKVTIVVATIGFTNGTAWRGQLYHRDPRAPDGWTTDEKPRGSAMLRTAFLLSSKFSHSSFHPSEWESRTSELHPPIQAEVCGRATIATSNCIAGIPECKYEYVGIFNSNDPLKRDKVITGFVPCFIIINGTSSSFTSTLARLLIITGSPSQPSCVPYRPLI